MELTLCNRELWETFRQHNTEMVVSNVGRRMYPVISLLFKGLHPRKSYIVMVDFVLVDGYKYRFDVNSNGWFRWTENADGYACSRIYTHPETPASGASLMKSALTFKKLKLTNNPELCMTDAKAVLLNTMCRYMPRFHVIESVEGMHFDWESKQEFSFPEAEFITVSAYRNRQITELKIAANPFATAFRSGRLHGKAKRQRIECEEKEDGAKRLEDASEEACSSSKLLESENGLTGGKVFQDPGCVESCAAEKSPERNRRSSLSHTDEDKSWDGDIRSTCRSTQTLENEMNQRKLQFSNMSESTVSGSVSCVSERLLYCYETIDEDGMLFDNKAQEGCAAMQNNPGHASTLMPYGKSNANDLALENTVKQHVNRRKRYCPRRLSKSDITSICDPGIKALTVLSHEERLSSAVDNPYGLQSRDTTGHQISRETPEREERVKSYNQIVSVEPASLETIDEHPSNTENRTGFLCAEEEKDDEASVAMQADSTNKTDEHKRKLRELEKESLSCHSEKLKSERCLTSGLLSSAQPYTSFYYLPSQTSESQESSGNYNTSGPCVLTTATATTSAGLVSANSSGVSGEHEKSSSVGNLATSCEMPDNGKGTKSRFVPIAPKIDATIEGNGVSTSVFPRIVQTFTQHPLFSGYGNVENIVMRNEQMGNCNDLPNRGNTSAMRVSQQTRNSGEMWDPVILNSFTIGDSHRLFQEGDGYGGFGKIIDDEKQRLHHSKYYHPISDTTDCQVRVAQDTYSFKSNQLGRSIDLDSTLCMHAFSLEKVYSFSVPSAHAKVNDRNARPLARHYKPTRTIFSRLSLEPVCSVIQPLNRYF